MKKYVKLAFFGSVKFIETLISISSVVLFSSFSTARNFKRYKKNNKNTDCFIIGNGYSLRKVLNDEIEIFGDQDVFTVNLFYETIFFHRIKPPGHIIADEGFWQSTFDERILEVQKRFKENLLTVTWNMNLFVPYEGYMKLSKVLESNELIKIVPYNRTPVTGNAKISHFLYRKNLGMPKPSNVLNAAIFLGLNLGYKKIYLYGADHSWISDLFVDENNDICCYENHFYDNTRTSSKMSKGSLSLGLKSIVDAFESYKLLDIYAKRMNSRIINKTKGSFIDIFDKN